MANVCFYLGAGASCQALPLVKQIPDRLQQAIEFLQRDELRPNIEVLEDDSAIDKSIHVSTGVLINDLRWLREQSMKHATIDTFAKKLHIRSEYDELLRLKSALVAFFTIEQFRNSNVDPRYDAFFSSILDSSPYIPDNIRIISWNYDLQLEMALSEYSGTKKIGNNSSNLRSTSKGLPLFDDDHYMYYKINGIADYIDRFKTKSLSAFNPSSDAELLKAVVTNHHLAVKEKKLTPLISFAWEPERLFTPKEKSVEDAANSNISGCDILVVIGYSFPFFNRRIDKKIISGMNLKKVYIQDINAEAIIDRFQAINTTIERRNIVAIQNDMEQFFIPHEI